MGIDLAGAHGSGRGGRVVHEDLRALAGRTSGTANGGTNGGHAGGPAPLARTHPGGGPAHLAAPEVRPLSMMRKTIARRLTEAKQTVPHFYLTIDVDAEPIARLREHINAELASESQNEALGKRADGDQPKPLKVSINDLLIKACATALARVPECNAQFTPEAILVHKRVDISVAVAIPDGLITPVVRNADQKSVVTIAREVRELAARARAKKLGLEEISDGTFSISNLGMFGIDEFSAVINPPEGAILAVGQIREEPVVREGQSGDKVIVPGKKLAMTLSCDHRVVDGAVGAAFLAELRALLDRPMRILTG
jgi:pyruvate dehydrogenase E2 component (dihydrolipoamide acetyltransferase)